MTIRSYEFVCHDNFSSDGVIALEVTWPLRGTVGIPLMMSGMVFASGVCSKTGKPSKDSNREEETRRRIERALRAAFNTPPKPQSEMKLGKPRGKPRKSPAKRKAGKPGRCESCVLSFALARA